jgi:hypothetical protein
MQADDWVQPSAKCFPCLRPFGEIIWPLKSPPPTHWFCLPQVQRIFSVDPEQDVVGPKGFFNYRFNNQVRKFLSIKRIISIIFDSSVFVSGSSNSIPFTLPLYICQIIELEASGGKKFTNRDRKSQTARGTVPLTIRTYWECECPLSATQSSPFCLLVEHLPHTLCASSSKSIERHPSSPSLAQALVTEKPMVT